MEVEDELRPTKRIDKTMKQFPILRQFLSLQHPFNEEGFDPTEKTFQYLRNECRVLVIGAGGLGCEILKSLSFCGFGHIDIIDMDTVDVSNLNRQFLFRMTDISKPKAEVAATFIQTHCHHLKVHVTPHVCKIQDKNVSFYKQFNLIIAGLDNVEARRWINSLLHSIVVRNEKTNGMDLSTVIPLLDGGTEGFKGQSRVIIPYLTSCFECSLDMFPPTTTYPLCTIAETPRLPEHCVEYAFIVQWPKFFPNKKPDLDDPRDLQWVTTKAKEHSEIYGIEGVDEKLSLSVIKRIVPAIASTNALIASSLVTEALKLSTYCAPVLNSYFMYMGQAGVYTLTFPLIQKKNCLVCGDRKAILKVTYAMTLEDLIEELRKNPEFRLEKPSLSTTTSNLFFQNPESLRKQHEHKLTLTLKKLMEINEIPAEQPLYVTDPSLESGIKLFLDFETTTT